MNDDSSARLNPRSSGGMASWAAAVEPVSTRGPRGCGLGAWFGRRVARGGGAACRVMRRPWRAAVASSDASRKGRRGLGDGGKHAGEVAGRRAREGSRTATRQQGFGGDARRERCRGQFGHGDHAQGEGEGEAYTWPEILDPILNNLKLQTSITHS